MYDIFGCASDFAHNFRHLMPTTLNCGATSIVNQRNKWTFTNNSNLREGSKVPLNPSDKRGKAREKIPSYLLPLSGELGI